jgi:predicted nuclease with TOPRIM domain
MTEKMTKTLAEQIQITTDNLTEFETEQTNFQEQMTLAVGEGEASKMIDLKRRHTELPVKIEAARIRLAKLYLQLYEERMPGLQSKVNEFHEPIQEAIAERDAAVLELGKVQGAYHDANENLREVKIRIGEQKRELDRLIYLANPAKGVKQSTHAGV